MKRTFPIRLWPIVLVSILSLATLVTAAPLPGVAWRELGQHLERKQIPLEDLPVTGCPRNVGERQPERLVAQWIENTFYLWQEYDIATATDTNICVVMLKPQPQQLTAAEARTLLTASTLWRQLPPAPKYEETLEPSDPDFIHPIPEPLPFVTDEDLALVRDPGVPESEVTRPAGPAGGPDSVRPSPRSEETRDVLGADDRARVTNTKAYPWYLMSYLESKRGDNYYRGSGCAVTPYMILTCAHNVYNQQSETWTSSMKIVPGQRQYSHGGTIYRPWGTRWAAWFRCNSPYTSGGSWPYDYAAVHFEDPFWSVATYLPVEFDTQLPQGDVLNMSGYPSNAGGGSTFGQWYCSGKVLFAGDRTIRLDFDATPGNSGSAMYYYVPSEKIRRICGILAFGGSSYNGGPQLVSQNKDLILGWMQWTPDRETQTGAAEPESGAREDGIPLVEVAQGEDIVFSSDVGPIELIIAPQPDPTTARLHLRYRPPAFAVWFEGNWMPIGIPNAAANTYGKGFKLRQAKGVEGQGVWTFQHSLDDGEFGVYAKEADAWVLKSWIKCKH